MSALIYSQRNHLVSFISTDGLEQARYFTKTYILEPKWLQVLSFDLRNANIAAKYATEAILSSTTSPTGWMYVKDDMIQAIFLTPTAATNVCTLCNIVTIYITNESKNTTFNIQV
ncbi:hypothetical protein GQX74_005206 [Glossina fuscipes]|nr:hypothetical protein GQX74_005206 [Glossina fuscipes]